VSVYRASMRSTTFLCRPRLHSSFHKALWSTESKAALRSTKAIQIGLWKTPSCFGWLCSMWQSGQSLTKPTRREPTLLLCARSQSRTLFSSTMANTLPGTDRRVESDWLANFVCSLNSMPCEFFNNVKKTFWVAGVCCIFCFFYLVIKPLLLVCLASLLNFFILFFIYDFYCFYVSSRRFCL